MAASHPGREGAELSLVTHEQEPLDIFGPAASDDVRALVEQAGIRLVTSSVPTSVEKGRLVMADGEKLGTDRIVSFPRLEVGRQRLGVASSALRARAGGRRLNGRLAPPLVAARRGGRPYLAPYLAKQRGDSEPAPPLSDFAASPGLGQAVEELGDGVELTLVAADASARWRDFESALHWLAAAEQLNVALPPEYAEKRRLWKAALAEGQGSLSWR